MPICTRVGNVDICLGGAPIAAHISRLSDDSQARPPNPYPHRGQSVHASPTGYRINCLKRVIGHGAPAYHRASRALETGEAFELPWIRFWRRGHGHRWATNDSIVLAARVAPLLWSANVNEVVHVRRRKLSMTVVWGTTPRHVLAGEEAVQVWQEGDGRVFFQLRSFSRPNVAMAWLTYPLIVYLQHAFARDVSRKLATIANDSLHSSPHTPRPVERGKPKQDNLRGTRRRFDHP